MKRRHFLKRIGAALAGASVAGVAAQAVLGSAESVPKGTAAQDAGPAPSYTAVTTPPRGDWPPPLKMSDPAMPWKNYTARYEHVDKDELIRKMSEAYRKIKFVKPASDARVDIRKVIDSPETTKLLEDVYGEELTARRKKTFEDLANAMEEHMWGTSENQKSQPQYGASYWIKQAEEKGFNGGAPKDMMVGFAESDKDGEYKDPVYQVDHESFYPIAMYPKAEKLEPLILKKTSKQEQFYVDMQYNYTCIDRRRSVLGAST